MEPAPVVKREIMREYNRDPTGWHVFTKRDADRHFDTIIIHGRHVWLLKEEHVNPYETVGFGLREVLEQPMSSLPPMPTFGFRPLSGRAIARLQRLGPESTGTANLLVELLSRKPAPLPALTGRRALEGPIVASPDELELFPAQRSLDAKLRGELDTLLHRRYPHLGTTYA
jgi:hypothetical protein